MLPIRFSCRSLMLSASLILSALAQAGGPELSVNDPLGEQGSITPILISFNGDGLAVASFSLRLSFDPARVTPTQFQTDMPGTLSCGTVGAQINCAMLAPTFGLLPASGTVTIRTTVASNAAVGSFPLTLSNVEYTDAIGNKFTPGPQRNGTYTVSAALGPSLSFQPATGIRVNLGGGDGLIGGIAAALIAVSPTPGSGSASTTINQCTITGAGSSFGSVSTINLSFTSAGATQNLPLTCTRAANEVSGSLSCREARAGQTPTTRSWPVLCPGPERMFANGFEL